MKPSNSTPLFARSVNSVGSRTFRASLRTPFRLIGLCNRTTATIGPATLCDVSATAKPTHERGGETTSHAVIVEFIDKPSGKQLSLKQCLDNARLCRDMAAHPGNREHQSFLLEMARSWEELAAARSKGGAAH